MSDVLIICSESPAVERLREALERDGYIVATASTLTAALPELYLSPCALRVIVSGEAESDIREDILCLAAADPGVLGRHSYAALELGAALEPGMPELANTLL